MVTKHAKHPLMGLGFRSQQTPPGECIDVFSAWNWMKQGMEFA
jgi:hypothetical protein